MRKFSILALDSFTRAAGRWVGDLMSKVPDLLQRCEDPQLQGQYISVLLEGHEYQAISAVEDLEIRGIRAFKAANDPVGEGKRQFIERADLKVTDATIQFSYSMS
jgi:hypothetical protein